MENELRNKTIAGVFWKFAERISAQLVSFIVSIILARLLVPEAYGVIALITVFITLCDEFITSGLNTALIQKKNADNVDFSTIFYFSFTVSVVLYVVLFFAAPFIAVFYDMPIISPVLRVMGLRIIVGAVNSVQHAYVSRSMQFRRFFYSTIIGTIASAVVGIAMAYGGYGVWALVAQYCLNSLINTLVLWFTVKWRPELKFSFMRLKSLYSYGWKIFAASMLRTLYNNLRSLIIGKLYSSEDLAYYNKGQSFPSLISTNINGTIDSVLFPAISKKQNDYASMKLMLRRSIKVGSYIMMPMMIGMAAVAPQLISVLLTDKWMGSVVFLRISCIAFALAPIETENLQAIKAMGKSGLVLKIELLKKAIGLLLLVVSMKYGVVAIATSLLVSTIIGTVINAFPNKRLLNYSILEQVKDILPSVVLSVIMAAVVVCVVKTGFNTMTTLILQFVIGAFVYMFLSHIFKLDSYTYVLGIIKEKIQRR